MVNVTASPIPNLSDRHYAELKASGLTDEIIKERGVFTSKSKEDLEYLLEDGLISGNQLGAGMVFPLYLISSKKPKRPSGYQVKLDNPRKDDSGRVCKYETTGKRPLPVDIGWSSKPDDADVIITEGIKKADALRVVFPDALVMGLSSCNGGLYLAKNAGVMRADVRQFLEHRKGVQFYLCFDNDIQVNPYVWEGVNKYRNLLVNNGFKVRIVTLPSIGTEKVGADDLLVSHGADILKSFFLMASEDMPKKPEKMDGRSHKSPERRAAEEAGYAYKVSVDVTKANLSDIYATQLWLGEYKGSFGDEIKPMRDNLIFDQQTGYPYAFNKDNRTYTHTSDDMGIKMVGDWFADLINKHKILVPPERGDFGLGFDGDKEYMKALKIRNDSITALTSRGKASSVYGLLKGSSEINHYTFNDRGYDHLFPLQGGMSIDMSKPDCPLTTTPTDARFTWCSSVSGVEYKEAFEQAMNGERPKRWMGFVKDLMDGRAQFAKALHAVLGYFMQGHRRHLFFNFHGEGRNGKGVILRLKSYLFGRAIDGIHGCGSCDIDPKAFVGQDRRHDQHWLLHKNRRMVVAEDPEGYVNESRVLSYAGGDPILGEVKGGASISFTPTAALVFAGQGNRVQFHLADDALRDRMLGIIFTKQFKGAAQDQNLEADLRSEAPLILCYLAKSAYEYISSEDKMLKGFTWMVECRNEIMKLGNTVAEFWENQDVFVECKMFDKNGDILLDEDGIEVKPTVSQPNFLAHYEKYCKENGLKAMDNRNGDVVGALQALVPGVKTARRRRDERDKNDKDNRRRMVFGIDFADHIDLNSRLTDESGEIDPPWQGRSDWSNE